MWRDTGFHSASFAESSYRPRSSLRRQSSVASALSCAILLGTVTRRCCNSGPSGCRLPQRETRSHARKQMRVLPRYLHFVFHAFEREQDAAREVALGGDHYAHVDDGRAMHLHEHIGVELIG